MFFLFKDRTIICLFIIYIYLIFNSFISLEIENSLTRNIGFVRFILLFLALNYIFFNLKNINFFFKIWTLIIIIVLADCFYEIIFGHNILGYSVYQGSLPQGRIVSFFKDELIIKNYNAILETLEKEKSNNTLKGDLIKSSFVTSSMGVSYKIKLGKNL